MSFALQQAFKEALWSCQCMHQFLALHISTSNADNDITDTGAVPPVQLLAVTGLVPIDRCQNHMFATSQSLPASMLVVDKVVCVQQAQVSPRHC